MEQELLKLVNSLKEDISNLDEYSTSTSSSDNDWPLELINNIISKVSYLKSNLNNLNDAEIKELKNSLEDVIKIHEIKKAPVFITSLIASTIGGLICSLLSLIVLSWWNAALFFLLMTLSFMFKNYPYLKEDIGGKAFKKLDENIDDIKELDKELTKILAEQKTYQVEETKEIKEEVNKEEYTLVNLINDTKRNIMMLNNSDEPEFNKRLALALTEFKSSLASVDKMPNNMKKDMEYFTSSKLTKELKSINEDALKLYQENKQKMKDETIDKLINDYMSNIDDSKDKIAKFINLKNSIASYLDNEDILSKMQIEERLASCFYYTVKDFNIDEVKSILDLIDENFYEAFTIFGEELINEREDNLEIMDYYRKLKELKKDLDNYTYLLDLCSFLIKSKTLKLKYAQNKNNILNRELSL